MTQVFISEIDAACDRLRALAPLRADIPVDHRITVAEVVVEIQRAILHEMRLEQARPALRVDQ